MKKWCFVLLTLALLVSACTSPSATQSPVSATPTADSAPGAAASTTQPAAPDTGGVAGEPLPTDRGQHFAGSGLCSTCHGNMQTVDGVDVSTPTYWRSTMMANAARDPYWQAAVRSEIERHPDYAQVIVDKCATCHTPMARFTAATQDQEVALFEDGFLSASHPLHSLAMDSVSCTLCHQIEADNLGTEESYSGHYAIDTQKPLGERVNYGPFAMDPQQAQIMQGASGFIPVQGDHLHGSEMCATCHTLFTPTIDANGEVAGELPEQTPYLEWLNSAFVERQSCQSCHMPPVEGGVVLSITGGEPRSPVSRHEFVGGNQDALRIFSQHGTDLGATASQEQFEATIARALDQLQARTASIAISELSFTGGQLGFQVTVTNQAGHKLPTSYPSRRAWLHVVVSGADGSVLFESGRLNPDGSIAGNDNDADPATYEPHFDLIEAPEQVQIYEAIMVNTEGEVTTTLLSGAGYIKDNRLLPEGFDKESASPDIAVQGEAASDASFAAGQDQLSYQIDTAGASAPFGITVELLYQSIGYRWAHNLAATESEEVQRFQGYYAGLPHTPVVVASAAGELAP